MDKQEVFRASPEQESEENRTMRVGKREKRIHKEEGVKQKELWGEKRDMKKAGERKRR